ncbi:hypothetical protein K501DRAFT_243441 [Backusella circina FSU 941]|nr:hypothetical protein K501DRAFT_243441 [Backusella circina FSU 941]
MLSSSYLSITLVLVLFFYQCSAQLGTTIYTPVSNDTVYPGQEVDTAFSYANIGTGNYSINVDLWQDAAATSLAKNIASNVTVQGGNSTGNQVAFTINSTYTWTVPEGLNETVYLTVTTYPNSNFFKTTMRSRPLLIHVSGAIINEPFQKWSLFALCFAIGLYALS